MRKLAFRDSRSRVFQAEERPTASAKALPCLLGNQARAGQSEPGTAEGQRCERYWRRQVTSDHTGYCQEVGFHSEGNRKLTRGVTGPHFGFKRLTLRLCAEQTVGRVRTDAQRPVGKLLQLFPWG